MQTVRLGTMEYECSREIPVPHGFTTRLGGVSQGPFGSLNLGWNRENSRENVVKNYEILANALDFDLESLVLTHQVHSGIVRCVDGRDALGLDHHRYPECDGLITNTPGVTLGVFTADCTPVLLWDPVTGAVGAVHAGWRGTALDIAGAAVRELASHFGCLPQNIRAAIGPNIGPCCFETDGDVPQALLETYGEEAGIHIRPQGVKFYVDLKAVNALSLRRAGVVCIDMSLSCTRCAPNRFYSHRVQGARRGSQGAFIVRK